MHLCTYVDYVTRFGQRCRFLRIFHRVFAASESNRTKVFFFRLQVNGLIEFFFFTEFYRVDVVEFSIFHCAELEILLNGVRLIFLCTTQFVPYFTGYCFILLSFTEFYWLPSHFLTWFYLVFVSFFDDATSFTCSVWYFTLFQFSFAGYCFTLLGFTEFYRPPSHSYLVLPSFC